jgi:hypothetical protein
MGSLAAQAAAASGDKAAKQVMPGGCVIEGGVFLKDFLRMFSP